MQSIFNVLMAQINPTVGAIDLNAKKIITIIQEQQNQHDLLVFPELALTGYPPEDLLFRKEFHQKVLENLQKIQEITLSCYLVLGYPVLDQGNCYNAMGIFYQGKKIREYRKQHLPNYEVFDETRYFLPGKKDPCILEIRDYKIGICICEDLWQPGPVEELMEQGISVFLSINASPFDEGKYLRREKLLGDYARQGVAVIYVNQVAGQDELLFDGLSLVMDKTGKICARSPAFEEDLCSVRFEQGKITGPISPLLSKEALLYKALVFGTKDYLRKNHFTKVVLGLSGGIDSALTLAIAVDALGAEQVHAVMLPSAFTAPMSQEDALQQIQTLGVTHSTLAIGPLYQMILSTLDPVFKTLSPNLQEECTEENIQARIRGLLLMAISNKTHALLLSTSNKSETAVGYATLYGDMAGGFCLLKDVLKTQVYALAQYRNLQAPTIPQRVMTRAPSAELKSNQCDQDVLPDYFILDAILVAYMENDHSPEELIQQGFPPETVYQVIQLIQKNEYKRRQAAPGIKISPIAFGKDWRYPIAHGFRD